MRDVKSQKFPGYLTYQLFVSEAFRKLKPAARDILTLLYFRVEMSKRSRRSRKYTPTVTNRHNIKLPYEEIRMRLGYSAKTIWDSYRQFFEHGFLEIVKHGGGSKGDIQIYRVTEDWRCWKPGDVVRTIETNGKFGWQRKQK